MNLENISKTLWDKEFPLKRQYICKQINVSLPVASRNFHNINRISAKFEQKLKNFILSHSNYFTENELLSFEIEK